MILTVLPVLLCATDAVDMQQSLITAHRQLHLEAHTRDHEVPVPPTTGGALPGIKMDCSMMQGGGDVIKTPGLFNFLELPSELRIQIYELLLVSVDVIEIPLTPPALSPPPHTSILQTCKRIDEEASSILYGKNSFSISLASDSKLLAHLFSKFRWSTLSSIATLKFTSSSAFLRLSDITGTMSIPPHFTCSGTEIIDHFTESDVKYSPRGPDRFMVLHIATWISTNVTRAELSAVQRDLELVMAQEGDIEI